MMHSYTQWHFRLILSAFVLLGACSTGNSKQMPRSAPVIVDTAARKSIPLQLKTIGNVEPYNSVAIKALAAGAIEGVYFQEGQNVKKDELLFKIDATPYEAALKQAEAALARDLVQFRNAEEQAKRYAALVEKDYVSRDQYDQVRANAEALASVVEADRANVENARHQLSFCTVKSPINGRAGSILVNAGNVVKANEVVLTTINQIAPIYVSFSVPEQNLAEIKRYMQSRELKVDALIPGEETRPVRGLLTFIDNAVDRTTGTIRLKGTFENADRRLWPGQFVDVILTLTTEQNRIVVPSQAVQTGQQGLYVYVVKDDMTAELRVVRQDRIFDGLAVIGSGVAAGEKVVIDGQMRIVPGAKVELKPPASETTGGK